MKKVAVILMVICVCKNTIAQNVGIGIAIPTQKLDVVGAARISGNAGTPVNVMGRSAAGDIADYTATTAVNNSAFWGLRGNAGTVDGTNFIGTTDNIALSFRVNNTKAGNY